MPSLYIDLNSSEPGFDPFVNGKAVSAQADEIGELCALAGLASPFDFCSVSDDEIAEFLEAEGLDDVEMESQGEAWFSADQGLAWTTGLRAAIERSPESLPDADAVRQDLAEYDEVFRKARDAGLQWRFAVDY